MIKLIIIISLITFCYSESHLKRFEEETLSHTTHYNEGMMYTKYMFCDPNNQTIYYLLANQKSEYYIAPRDQYLICGGIEINYQDVANRTLIYQIPSNIKKYSLEYLYIINKQNDDDKKFIKCVIDQMNKKNPINILLSLHDFDYINYVLAGYILLLVSFLISLNRKHN